MRKLICATLLAGLVATNLAAEELSPPAAADANNLPQASSSVGTSELLITVLAALLVWAAVDQNARAK